MENIQIASRESLIAGGVHPIATDLILAAQGKRQGRQLHIPDIDASSSSSSCREHGAFLSSRSTMSALLPGYLPHFGMFFM